MAQREKPGRPPGPRGHWLRGNTRAYEADRIGFLRRCHRQYGDVFSYDDHTWFVIDPELAHEALTRTGDSFVTELAPFDMRRDLDQASAHAMAWMSDRRSAWPGLNRTAAATTDDLTATTLDAVVADGAGRDVDVLTMMRTLTARTIAAYCFGADSMRHSRAAPRDRPRHPALRGIVARVPRVAAAPPPPPFLPDLPAPGRDADRPGPGAGRGEFRRAPERPARLSPHRRTGPVHRRRGVHAAQRPDGRPRRPRRRPHLRRVGTGPAPRARGRPARRGERVG